MANILEEKLREATCVGDIEAVEILLSQNVNVNSQNPVNGWTPLHWACKRGHERIARLLITYGADTSLKNFKGEVASDICSHSTINELLGIDGTKRNKEEGNDYKFVANYMRNAPINPQVDVGPFRFKQPDLLSMPKTSLPTAQNDELVLKVIVQGSSDPDFIEIEIPRWKLTYDVLLKVCCQELHVQDSQVERIRKLPNTRLRKDNDVRRLVDFQELEIALKSSCGDKSNNCYQSISTCKDQTILY